jgi:hypothetical protein
VRWLIASCVVAVLGLPQSARAQSGQTDPMTTDRPDFTESSEVIRRGGFQLETGMTLEGETDRSRAFTAPAALFRLGLGHRTELRFGGDGILVADIGRRDRTSGYSDVEIAAKIRLFNQDQIGVDLAVIPILSLPVGSDGFSSGTYDPTIKITWARELPAGFGLSGNVNVSAVSDPGGRFYHDAVSVSVGDDLSAGWGSYAEIYGFSRFDRDGGRAVIVNGGVSRPVGNRMQFDLEAGGGITAAAPDWFVGVGFAIRGSFGR